MDGNTGNRYSRIIELIFQDRYRPGDVQVLFSREHIAAAANRLGIQLPKNLGDVLYSFRYRAPLPKSILESAPSGHQWVIRALGRSSYAFILVRQLDIAPNSALVETKILDSTPGVVSRYALNDEQGLLTKLRYNRLIYTFLGLTCYSLQNHLRTTVKGIGQVETDELYIGLDKRGVHYAVPVQAKGAKDQIGQVQIEQDVAMCQEKFPHLAVIPIAAKFMAPNLIALFAFEATQSTLDLLIEKHYRLVAANDLSTDELISYQLRPL